MLHVKVKRLSETATLPTYGSNKAAGMDLYADLENLDSLVIYPHCLISILLHFPY